MSLRKIISRYSYSYIYPSNDMESLPVSTNKDKNKCLDFDLDRVNFAQPIKRKPSEEYETQNISTIDFYDDIIIHKDLAKKTETAVPNSKKGYQPEKAKCVYYSDKV